MIIMMPVSESAGHGFVSMAEVYGKIFGQWAVFAWLLSGVLGFLGLIGTGMVFMPEIITAPADGMLWFIDCFLFVICLFSGPAALFGVPLLFIMFCFFNWLMPI